MTESRLKELIRLVELDYGRTATFINGITSTGATIRGWAVTVWLAVLGIAFDRSQWELAALASLLAAVFLLIDGYHAWLYGEAIAHAHTLERLWAAYYDYLRHGPKDADAAQDLTVRIEAHRLGLYRNFRQFRPRDLRFARPKVIFRLFYPMLIIVAIAVAFYIGPAPSAPPPCSVVPATDGAVIDCGDVKIVKLPPVGG